MIKCRLGFPSSEENRLQCHKDPPTCYKGFWTWCPSACSWCPFVFSLPSDSPPLLPPTLALNAGIGRALWSAESSNMERYWAVFGVVVHFSPSAFMYTVLYLLISFMTDCVFFNAVAHLLYWWLNQRSFIFIQPRQSLNIIYAEYELDCPK